MLITKLEVKQMGDKKNKERSLASSFASNTAWQIAQQIYSMMISLVIGAISARYLGPSNYGLLNYGTSLINLMVTLTALGLDEVIMNDLVNDRDHRSKILGTALCMRLVASICGIFALISIVIVLEPDNKLLWLVTFLQSFQLIGNLYHVYNYWFQVELKSKFVSIAFIIGLTCASVWRVVMLIQNADVRFFAFTASIQSLVVLAVVVICFKREAKMRLQWDYSLAKALLKRSYHFIISAVAIMFYMQMDKVMIGKMLGEEPLGYYSAASTVANLWLFVPRALINSARPIVLEGKKIKSENNESEYINRLKKLVFSIILLGLMVGLVFTVFGKVIVGVMYGKEYSPAISVLNILIWATCLAQLGSVNGIWIASEGYNKWLKYTTFFGAFVNLILNYVFIGRIGIIGAAIATLLAQFSVQFIAPLFFRDLRQYYAIYGLAIKEFKNIKQYIVYAYHLIRKKKR